MFTVATFYKFINLSHLESIQKKLKQKMLSLRIKGTILIASEGLNATICGSDDDIKEFYFFITKLIRRKNINWKLSYSEFEAFSKVKVRRKDEIVTIKKTIKSKPGKYISPDKWDNFISRDDVILIETRNKYEYDIGTFENAILPNINYFRDFPAWIDNYLKGCKKEQKIAMFCTGGIRCEKTTAYLKDRGFDNVFHLKGGILNYLEKTENKNKKWQGDCFVFDDRVAVDEKLASSFHQLDSLHYTN